MFDALNDAQFRKQVVRGLLDAGNRGVVGSVLGFPVDIATLLGRPFGYNVEKPVGGSEWIGQKMQDAGMVSPERNLVAEGLASFALPMGAAKIAPKLFAADQKMIANALAPDPFNAATRYMREAGIPGIRYLDGGSRATGGTSNYVVFPGNEGLLNILERNGQALNPASKPFIYPQDKALATAQLNAAKSLDDGGLGLAAGNTPMERAQAMGYPMDMYGRKHSPIGITNHHGKPSAPIKKAQTLKAEIEQMGIPVTGEQAATGSTYLTVPGNPYPVAKQYGGGFSVPQEQIRFSTHSTRAGGIPINEPSGSYLADVFPKHGNSLDDARSALQQMIDRGGIRSRFAAFDPARRNEADILGRADPELLKWIAGAGLLGTAGYSALQDR